MPIWIGVSEGFAIVQALEEHETARPMTHDLMTNILKEFDMKVVRVVVTDLKKNTFYARIIIETDGTLKEIDARPSDSIALALRTGAPIFVAKSVLSQSGISPTEGPLEPGKLVEVDTEELKKKQYVKTVTSSPLFGIDSKFQSDLDNNTIPDDLRQEFESNKALLSSDATVSASSWQIVDKGNLYTIRKREDKLDVYVTRKVKLQKKEEK
jgi:bifunctional DNase/RNase